MTLKDMFDRDWSEHKKSKCKYCGKIHTVGLYFDDCFKQLRTKFDSLQAKNDVMKVDLSLAIGLYQTHAKLTRQHQVEIKQLKKEFEAKNKNYRQEISFMQGQINLGGMHLNERCRTVTELEVEIRKLKISTTKCRKNCDVYDDWQKLETDNVGLVLDSQKLQTENNEFRKSQEQNDTNFKFVFDTIEMLHAVIYKETIETWQNRVLAIRKYAKELAKKSSGKVMDKCLSEEKCLADKKCVHYSQQKMCQYAIKCRNEKIQQLQAEFAKLRWIPVGERLPTEVKQYPVWVEWEGTACKKVSYTWEKVRWIRAGDWDNFNSGNVRIIKWLDIILPEGD